MTNRPTLAVTNHVIQRWRERIEDVPEAQAVEAILLALQTAKAKHLTKAKRRKGTFYVPTDRALFVGSRGRLVTVLARR